MQPHLLPCLTFTGVEGIISTQSRLDLSKFIGRSVLPNTNRVYCKFWSQWVEFLKSEAGEEDPFLRRSDEEEKSSLVGIMMLRKHEQDLRGKKATAFTAGIRMRFSQQGFPTSFLESAVIASTRTTCKPKPEELREKRDRGTASTVKLPVCEEILTEMRVRMWDGRGWVGPDMRARMVYLGCMWGFEMGARVSEYTTPEPGAVDHCVRLDDLIFVVVSASVTRSLFGSQLVESGVAKSETGRLSIVECRAQSVTAKGKELVKPKIIGRRSVEETQFLEDLVDFVTHSRATGKEELFSFRQDDGRRVKLRSRTVRDELKDTCKRHGLDPDYFSSHSLRKGAITQMRSLGASEDDRRDRGNYVPNSQVMNNTYDYGTGLGPLGSNRLTGGYKPTVEDLKRLIPPTREPQK